MLHHSTAENIVELDFTVNYFRLDSIFKMGDEGFDFTSGDAGASETFPLQCSALRKGGFVMIKVQYYLFL